MHMATGFTIPVRPTYGHLADNDFSNPQKVIHKGFFSPNIGLVFDNFSHNRLFFGNLLGVTTMFDTSFDYVIIFIVTQK